MNPETARTADTEHQTPGALMQGRLFERDMHTEKFLSAADAGAVRSPLFKNV